MIILMMHHYDELDPIQHGKGFWVRLHDIDGEVYPRKILNAIKGWREYYKGDAFHRENEVFTITDENAHAIYEMLKLHFDAKAI